MDRLGAYSRPDHEGVPSRRIAGSPESLSQLISGGATFDAGFV